MNSKSRGRRFRNKSLSIFAKNELEFNKWLGKCIQIDSLGLGVDDLFELIKSRKPENVAAVFVSSGSNKEMFYYMIDNCYVGEEGFNIFKFSKIYVFGIRGDDDEKFFNNVKRKYKAITFCDNSKKLVAVIKKKIDWNRQ